MEAGFYFNHIELREDPFFGRSAVATHDIAMGELLIREPAILRIRSRSQAKGDEAFFHAVDAAITRHKMPKDASTMIYGLSDFLRASKDTQDAILGMACPEVSDQFQAKMLSVCSDVSTALRKTVGSPIPPPEVLERFCRIADINGHATPSSGWLLFLHGSKVAHSCAPTSSFSILSPGSVGQRYGRFPNLPFDPSDPPPLLQQVALCDIKQGDVVTMAYAGSAFDSVAPTAIRQASLEHLAFVCGCMRCRDLDYSRVRVCVACGAGKTVGRAARMPAAVAAGVRRCAGDGAVALHPTGVVGGRGGVGAEAEGDGKGQGRVKGVVGVVGVLCVKRGWVSAVAAAVAGGGAGAEGSGVGEEGGNGSGFVGGDCGVAGGGGGKRYRRSRGRGSSGGPSTASDSGSAVPIPYAVASVLHSAWCAARERAEVASAACRGGGKGGGHAAKQSQGSSSGGAVGSSGGAPAVTPRDLRLSVADAEQMRPWVECVVGATAHPRGGVPTTTLREGARVTPTASAAEPWLASQCPSTLVGLNKVPPDSPFVIAAVCLTCGVCFGGDSPATRAAANPPSGVSVAAAPLAAAVALEVARQSAIEADLSLTTACGASFAPTPLAGLSHALLTTCSGGGEGSGIAGVSDTLPSPTAEALKAFAVQCSAEQSILRDIVPRYLTRTAPRHTCPATVLKARSSVCDLLGPNHFGAPLFSFALCSLRSGADARSSDPWPPFAVAVAGVVATEMTAWLDCWMPWSQQAAVGHAVAVRVLVDSLPQQQHATFVEEDVPLAVSLAGEGEGAVVTDASLGFTQGGDTTHTPPSRTNIEIAGWKSSLHILVQLRRMSAIALVLRSAMRDASPAQLDNLNFVVVRLAQHERLVALVESAVASLSEAKP